MVNASPEAEAVAIALEMGEKVASSVTFQLVLPYKADTIVNASKSSKSFKWCGSGDLNPDPIARTSS
jgi:hypothetical protein